MKALVINAGSQIEIQEIDDKLETYQQIVGGYITTAPLQFCPASVAVMICNDEGLLLDLPENIYASCLYGGLIVGNAVVVGVRDDVFCDVPPSLLSLVPEFNEQIAEQM